MSYLVAWVGKDSRGIVQKLINSRVFENIYLVTDESGRDFIDSMGIRNVSYILIDFSLAVEDMTEELVRLLGHSLTKTKELDIALNISSGNGKEHAALISALMKLGYGIRFVDIDKTGDAIAL